jgi:hypothetical protein
VQVAWKQGENGNPCCQMMSEDGETVRLTFLRTAPDMTLGQVIEALGAPEFLTGQEFTEEQAFLSRFYPDVPMVIYAFVEGVGTGDVRSTF